MSNYVNKWDDQTKRIIGFFVAKGLLIANDVKPQPSVKINIEEAINIGLEVDQRILEVLPAAMLRFPKSFMHWEKVPDKLRTVLNCLKNNLQEGPDLGGIPYKNLKKWADFRLPDRRTIPVNERKVQVSWRLSRNAVDKIKLLASTLSVDETQIVEKLVESTDLSNVRV